MRTVCRRSGALSCRGGGGQQYVVTHRHKQTVRGAMADLPISPAEGMTAPGQIPGLPSAVWALGLTSLFMDISSETIHSIFPTFLVIGLGTSAVYLESIEGVAEATACIVKVFFWRVV